MKTQVPSIQKLFDVRWNLWDQNVRHVRFVRDRVAQGVFDQGYVVGLCDIIARELHEILRVRPALQIKDNLLALLGKFPGGQDDPSLIPYRKLKMARARLEQVMYSDETFVVLVRLWIVLYEVQVRAVGKGRDVRVPVRPVEVQVRTCLAIVYLGPVGGQTRDVIWFENFLDAVYGVPTVDDGPVSRRDLEETSGVNILWLHYNL